MTLNPRWSPSWLTRAVRSLGKGLAGATLLAAAGGLTAGCLDRPVVPATPQTTNIYISQLRQTSVDKIDLLFMVDNSLSMADKQQILAEAVPVLVQRLIQPTCVDADGNATGPSGTNGECPRGGSPEFKAVQNIHIGVITSSLGDHGSNDVCSPAQATANQAENPAATTNYNDLAQLLPSVRPAGLYSWNDSGFLVWDPRGQGNGGPPSDLHPNLTTNETNPDDFIAAFKNQIIAADQNGCGYESSLEAWYRFLVDPEPVATLTNDGRSTVRPKNGEDPVVNQVVLAQRQAFLRPDSLLAIVMLSDENDCSIVDEDNTQGWLVGYKGGVGSSNFHMPRASSTCQSNPNDKCCRPCGIQDSMVPAGCMTDSQDPACSMGATLSLNEDSMNERCFNQVRRFGVDLLYPTDRYVEALTSSFVHPRYGQDPVPNPIFAPGAKGEPPRDKGLVFLAGIVGVPWQDVSDEASWTGPSLTYLSADQLQSQGRWDVILGDPKTGKLPSDTLMVESIEPRVGLPQAHPLIPSIMIGAATATTNTNPINGHEQQVTDGHDDLQYACIFPLGSPVACTDANRNECDCNAEDFAKNSPLCTGGGVTMTTDGQQLYAKAYPGVRELQVLKDFGENAIVASICPKNVKAVGDPASDPNYGYNPAVAAIVERLKEALTVKCLPRPLTPGTPADSVEEDVGKVPCAVVEVRPQVNGVCEDAMCTLNGRQMLTGERAKVIPAAKDYLNNQGFCGGAGLPSCDSFCFCELQQFTGDDLRFCQTKTDDNQHYGYCYVDPAAAEKATPDDTELIDGENALVKDCPSTQKRILRFLGTNIPARDGLAFIACIGAAAD